MWEHLHLGGFHAHFMFKHYAIRLNLQRDLQMRLDEANAQLSKLHDDHIHQNIQLAAVRTENGQLLQQNADFQVELIELREYADPASSTNQSQKLYATVQKQIEQSRRDLEEHNKSELLRSDIAMMNRHVN